VQRRMCSPQPLAPALCPPPMAGSPSANPHALRPPSSCTEQVPRSLGRAAFMQGSHHSVPEAGCHTHPPGPLGLRARNRLAPAPALNRRRPRVARARSTSNSPRREMTSCARTRTCAFFELSLRRSLHSLRSSSSNFLLSRFMRARCLALSLFLRWCWS
jgi:hypothetical protein